MIEVWGYGPGKLIEIKDPVQEKISALEARIAALETAQQNQVAKRAVIYAGKSREFDAERYDPE